MILERQAKAERKKTQHTKDIKLLQLIADLLVTLKGGELTKEIDFYGYSDMWYQELKPHLLEKRSKNHSKRNVISLKSLMRDKNLKFEKSILERLYENIPYEEDLWTQVSSCIIAIPKKEI